MYNIQCALTLFLKHPLLKDLHSPQSFISFYAFVHYFKCVSYKFVSCEIKRIITLYYDKKGGSNIQIVKIRFVAVKKLVFFNSPIKMFCTIVIYVSRVERRRLRPRAKFESRHKEGLYLVKKVVHSPHGTYNILRTNNDL